ncbi:MAG: pyridoxal phosphate-dependent aminotransferase [Clostridiales bacterium]|nr:pyridoxal phosphate-dependent aminotransferase [Clostridiales bacterium]
MGISAKCRSIAPSATLTLDAKVKALRAAGEKVIGFAAGEPDFDTPLPIRDAMKEALDKGMTRYTPVPGTIELRDAIIKKMQKDFGLTYTRDEIIVSNGAKHSLYTALQTLCDPGDEVIIPTPCWVSYPEMVRMAGGVPIFVEAGEEEGFIPSLASIASAVTPKTKAFILTSPNNPNGTVWGQDILEALAALCVEKDFYILSDEIYERLLYDGKEHVSMASFAALSPQVKARTLLVNGVSKTYAMTGFRIGYTAGPRDVISAMTNYQSQATSAPNTPAQYAATVALSMPQDCVEEMRKAFETRRDLLVEGLNAIPGIHCVKPQGAFYVMMNISALLGKRLDDQFIANTSDFAEALLEKMHVAVVPGNAFMSETCCRLSYATATEEIKEGLRRIAAFVKDLR